MSCYYCNLEMEEGEGVSLTLKGWETPKVVHTRCVEKRLNAIENLLDCEYCGDLRWTVEYYEEIRHKDYCCRYINLRRGYNNIPPL